VYLKELSVRYRLRRVRGQTTHPTSVSHSHAAAAVLVPILRSEVVEVCGILCLSPKLHILAYHELSRGTLDNTIVHPRDVFRTALLAHASGVVVAHNHPSGVTTPSDADIALTQRLTKAGEIVGVDLVDHLIVAADGTCFSFRDSARL
jgi:DNA repair protein RadC